MSVWEKWGISPLEWQKIDKQTQMDLLTKMILDNERDQRLREKQSENSNNKGRTRGRRKVRRV
ncbi:MAG: hypothetical protein ACOCZ5_02360 [bacterium]